MAVFAIQLSDNQAKSKQDIEGRVHERSVLATALIDSLFQSAQQQIPAEAKLYGTPTVSEQLLDQKVGRNLVHGAGRPLRQRGRRLAAASTLRHARTCSVGDAQAAARRASHSRWATSCRTARRE